MTELEALVGLNLVLDIGSIRLGKLLGFFKSPENILKAQIQDLKAVSGIGDKIAKKINGIKQEDIEKEMELAAKNKIKILTCASPEYPANLKNIFDPPIILYVKGDLFREDNCALAIVGSRRASFYGLETAERFSRDLAGRGFTIVSGLARGIDTASHLGALKAKGRTIAVIGSGFNHIYPAENKKLAEEIKNSGALISEFPVNTGPEKQNFPRRNRVISGLSLGVLVVEAARNSGALITADFALEQAREVFALPGKVDSVNSFGTNELIKQGAKLVATLEDILEELPVYQQNPGFSPDAKKKKDQKAEQSLSCAEGELYNIISDKPLSVDDLVRKTDLNLTVLTPLLLQLVLKKIIKQLPGRQFVRNANVS